LLSRISDDVEFDIAECKNPLTEEESFSAIDSCNSIFIDSPRTSLYTSCLLRLRLNAESLTDVPTAQAAATSPASNTSIARVGRAFDDPNMLCGNLAEAADVRPLTVRKQVGETAALHS
jgi:hypothetical protein